MADQSRQPTLGFLLTPPGIGALAVIRVCGPEAVNAVADLFEPVSHSSRQAPDLGQPERLWYGRWVVNGEAVDEVIVCAGTGLDGHPQVDINAHGGIRVVERILMALQARGVEMGDAAQADRRSWPAQNRIEAEAVAALSQAKTRRAVDFLIHQQRGLPAFLTEIADSARSEPAAARELLQGLLDDAPGGRFLVAGAMVAIIGPPNSGKSTLANRLFGAPMAIVSPAAGTTLDWVAEPTAIRGVPVTLVDTPGVGGAADPCDDLAVRRGLARAAGADLLLAVLDGAAPWPEAFLEAVRGQLPGRHLIVVISKADLPRCWGDHLLPERWRDRDRALGVSAYTGHRMAELEGCLVAELSLAGRPDDAPRLFTERQCAVVADLLAGKELPGQDLARRLRRELIGLP